MERRSSNLIQDGAAWSKSAERELGAFLAAVTELFGMDRAQQALMQGSRPPASNCNGTKARAEFLTETKVAEPIMAVELAARESAATDTKVL